MFSSDFLESILPEVISSRSAGLRLLSKQRRDEVHIRAAWIFTRADIVANSAVIASGVAVLLTSIGYFDLFVGAAIGLYVVKEALEILRDAKKARLESKLG